MILSIVIPLYNTEKYIEECLLSIVDNNVDASLYEVIVVNDGSTDNSANIVKELKSKYNQISMIDQKNHGVSIARMNGVKRACGKYIWFIDSDDWLEPSALTDLFEMFRNRCEVDAFIAPFAINHIERRIVEIAPEIPEEEITSGRELLHSQRFIFVGAPYFVFKKSFLDDPWLFFPSNTRFEDEYFSRVLLYRLKSIYLLKTPVYHYRQNMCSFMHSNTLAAAPYIIDVYRHLHRFANLGIDPSDRKWFNRNIISFLLECITRNLSYVRTADFSTFYNEHIHYLRKEFYRNFFCFPVKEQVLGTILLLSPSCYASLISKHIARKAKKR